MSVDAPTGGRLVIKRGAEHDAEYRGLRGERQILRAPAPPPQPKRRKCRFCGRPLLMLGAPLVLVAAFAIRYQRMQGGSPFGAVSAFTALLEVQVREQDYVATVLVRPASGLASFLLRDRTPGPGSPVEVLMTTDDETALPVLLYGLTPGPGLPDTLLLARISTGGVPPAAIRATVSIGGRTVALIWKAAAGGTRR